MILTVVAMILLLIVTKKSTLQIKKVLNWTGIWIGLGIISVVLGVILSYLISIISWMEFSLTYMSRVSWRI